MELSLYWGLKCQNKEGFVYIFTFDFIYWKCWSTKGGRWFWKYFWSQEEVPLVIHGDVTFGILRRRGQFPPCILAFDCILGPNLDFKIWTFLLLTLQNVNTQDSYDLLLNTFQISLMYSLKLAGAVRILWYGKPLAVNHWVCPPPDLPVLAMYLVWTNL